MDATAKTAISIRKPLLDQADILARRLDLSQGDLLEIALERLLEDYADYACLNEGGEAGADQGEESGLSSQKRAQAASGDEGRREINQGDIYWIRPEDSLESNLGSFAHPYVVIQDDLFNRSRINTVVVCALTSNIKQANDPGNVLLDSGEADLPKQSAVVVSKISSVKTAQLGAYIGSLSKQRIDQILAGMRFLQLSYFDR